MASTTDIYELQLLSAVVKDTEIFQKVLGVADAKLFSSTLSAEVYDLIREFYQEYNRVPTHPELLHLYKRDRNVSDDQTIIGFLNAIYTQTVDTVFVLNELRRYVKLRRLENIFMASYEKVKGGSDVDVSAIVTDIFKVQMSALQDQHLYGVGIDESEHIMKLGETRHHIPTNIGFLNETLGGGLAGGQLGVILAPPNYGKTMTLLNFALYSWMKRHNVLFVTLEMPEFSILKRVMFLLSGALNMQIDYNSIGKLAKAVDKKFQIFYRPVKSITVDYLYSVVHQAAADGIKFDQVFIDYSDLLASTNKQKEKRFELADIFTSLKAFAQVLDIPVWSATQSNREGLRAETVDMSHMSESIDKAFISDVVLSLSDKIEADRVSKFFLTKHREGKSDVYIDMYVNSKMWIADADKANDISIDKIG
jgi:replicative DNA helicase